MSLPSTVVKKLSKLIPLLGSDKDGEVIASARAIRRTMESAGRDLHDLAARLAGSNRPRLERAPNADDDPDTWGWSEPPWSELPPTERLAALDFLVARFDHLSAWELRFVFTVRDRLRGNSNARLSDKQVRVLNGLLAKAREEWS